MALTKASLLTGLVGILAAGGATFTEHEQDIITQTTQIVQAVGIIIGAVGTILGFFAHSEKVGTLVLNQKTLAHENIALAQSAGETPSPIATATVGAKV